MQENWVLQKTKHLSVPSQRFLVQLLWVPDVGQNDAVKRQVVVFAGFQDFLQFVCSDGDLASDGVLGIDGLWVDI